MAHFWRAAQVRHCTLASKRHCASAADHIIRKYGQQLDENQRQCIASNFSKRYTAAALALGRRRRVITSTRTTSGRQKSRAQRPRWRAFHQAVPPPCSSEDATSTAVAHRSIKVTLREGIPGLQPTGSPRCSSAFSITRTRIERWSTQHRYYLLCFIE